MVLITGEVFNFYAVVVEKTGISVEVDTKAFPVLIWSGFKDEDKGQQHMVPCSWDLAPLLKKMK